MAFAICLAAMFVAMGWTAWPPLNSDAIYHVPPAFFLDDNGAWSNPLVYVSYEVTPLGDPKYNWHGLLLPSALALLPGKLTWGCVFLSLGVMNALAALGAAYASVMQLRSANSRRGEAMGMIVAALGLLVLSAFLVAYNGRHETMAVAAAAIGCGLACSPWRRVPLAHIFLGVLLALCALASPIPAVGIGAAYFIWLGQVSTGRALLQNILLGALGGIAVFVLFFAAYPDLGFFEWLMAMKEHSAVIGGARYVEFHEGLRQRLLFDTNFPLAILSLVSMAIAAASLPSRPTLKNRFVAFTGYLLLFAVVAYALESAFKIYVLMPLFVLAVPVMAAASMRWFENRQRVLACVLCAFLAPASMGYAGATAAWVDYLRRGVSLSAAHQVVEQVPVERRGAIGVTSITAVLFSELSRLRVCSPDSEGRLTFLGMACDLAVLDERSLTAQVGVLRGYRCIERTAFAPRPKLLGLPYANFGEGYQAALLAYDTTAKNRVLTQAELDACPVGGGLR